MRAALAAVDSLCTSPDVLVLQFKSVLVAGQVGDLSPSQPKTSVTTTVPQLRVELACNDSCDFGINKTPQNLAIELVQIFRKPLIYIGNLTAQF
jgi:hypothetical protein